MFDFFNEFFQSELVKNNVIVVVIISLFLVILGAGTMWLYMSKIYMKTLENENASLKDANEEMKSNLVKIQNDYDILKARFDSLVSSSKRLQFMDEQYVARNTDTSDSALDEFVNDK